MTEEMLKEIEKHANAVDSRMSENCLALIAALQEARELAREYRSQAITLLAIDNEMLRKHPWLKE